MSSSERETLPRLYEFLYRDPAQVISFIAQFNRGLITGIERTVAKKQATEGSLGFTSIFAGGFKSAKDDSTSTKESYQPHDQGLRDLLGEIYAAQFVHPHPDSAPHGSIIHLTGNLEFFDGAAIKLALELQQLAPSVVQIEPKVHQTAEERKRGKEQQNALMKLLKETAFPSTFMLFDDFGKPSCGTLKDVGLDEPLASFLFKYGGNQLPEIHILGIKELARTPTDEGGTGLALASRVVSKMYETLLFPPQAMRITPLLIYREVVPFG